jgi:hypothetical protein
MLKKKKKKENWLRSKKKLNQIKFKINLLNKFAAGWQSLCPGKDPCSLQATTNH